MEVKKTPVSLSINDVVRHEYIFPMPGYMLSHGQWVYLTKFSMSEAAIGGLLGCMMTSIISFVNSEKGIEESIKKISIEVCCEVVFFGVIFLIGYFLDGPRRKIKKDITTFFLRRM